jgi:hypothetical protein
MDNRDFLNSGLIARFLLCFPKSYIGERRYDTEPIGDETIKNYSDLICELLEKKFAYEGEEKLLKFTPETSAKFAQYYNDVIEPSLRNEFADCADWGGKYHGELLRLCGLLHVIDCVTNATIPEEISVELSTLERAVSIGEYYREQAIFAYSKSGNNAAIESAVYVLEKLKTEEVDSISKRDLLRLCRRFKSNDELNKAIEILLDYEYLREEIPQKKSTTGRKPIPVYQINPHIY